MNRSAIIILVTLFLSCNSETSIEPQSLDLYNYLGTPFTSREYEKTIWMFEENSDNPFVKVPDSLYSMLIFDTTWAKQGITFYNRYLETVINKDERDTLFSNLLGFQINILNIKLVNLRFELRLRSEGISYTGIDLLSYNDRKLWVENESEFCVQTNDSTKKTMLKKPLHIGEEWIREELNYLGYLTFRQECKVISFENVLTKAGVFQAFKIEVTNHWVYLDLKEHRNFEYYVPNIGLVLWEYEGLSAITELDENDEYQTKNYKRKERVELLSYNFKQN